MSMRTDVLRIITAGAMVLALAIRHSQRRLVWQLVSAAALGRESAIELKDLHALRRFVLRRLTTGGAVIELPGGKYYLDTKGFEAFRRHRKRFALGLVGLIVAAFAAMWWGGGFR